MRNPLPRSKPGWLVLVAFVVNIAAVGTVWLDARDAQEAATDAQDAVDLVNEQRAEARVASCHKDNETVDKINGILLTFAGAVQSEEGSAFIESLVLPRRDCTEAGIDAYLSTTTTVP